MFGHIRQGEWHTFSRAYLPMIYHHIARQIYPYIKLRHILYLFSMMITKWKQFPRYWPCQVGIHRWSVDSPHKGQCRRALMFSLICAPQQTVDQTVETAVISDAIAFIMTSLFCHSLWAIILKVSTCLVMAAIVDIKSIVLIPGIKKWHNFIIEIRIFSATEKRRYIWGVLSYW